MNLSTLRPGSDGLIRWRVWIVPTRATLPAYGLRREGGKPATAKPKATKPKKEKLPPSQWPKLSEQLTGPRHPERCQACSAPGVIHSNDGSHARGTGATLHRWREFDENDRPTSTLIVLCEACGDKLIERHPRLYEVLDPFEPLPGAMPVCAYCWFRQELRCRHPDLKANGGEGLKLDAPEPMRGFIDYSGKMKKHSGPMVVWCGPVKCEGHEILETKSNDKSTIITQL